MGGNALKGFVERKSKHEHVEIVQEVLAKLYNVICQEVVYISNKETFGDTDIVYIYPMMWTFGQLSINVLTILKQERTETFYLLNTENIRLT